MKLHATIQRMLRMCPEAWKLFLRCLQLACFFLFCALLLLIAWDADRSRAYSLYQLSSTMQEMAQITLIGAVILPPCVEEA